MFLIADAVRMTILREPKLPWKFFLKAVNLETVKFEEQFNEPTLLYHHPLGEI